MKILNKQELQRIASNNSSDIDKKCTAKPYSFLVIDATLASDNPLCFRKNLVDGISKLIMTVNDKIGDEKL